MALTPTGTEGVFKNPITGEEFLYGDPNANVQKILGEGLEFVRGQDIGAEQRQTYLNRNLPSVITGDLLTPSTGLPFVGTTPTPVSPVFLPDKPAPLGKEQQEESNLNKRLRELQDIIAGTKPAFEIEQRQKFGFEEKTATQESIYRQMQNLKAFTENIPAQLLAESVGRGRTAAGIAPIEIGRLRQAGIQATILNAQYAAATADLATAERQIKQAVHDKFAPLEAEYNAKLTNLGLIKDSPEYTNEQRARAAKQEAKTKADKDKADKAKGIYEEILKLATKVTGSDVQDGQNSLIANQITDLVNTDAEAQAANVDLFAKAQTLAAKYLVKKEKEPSLGADINEFKAFFPNVDVATPEGRQQFLNWKAQVGEAVRAPSGVTKPTIVTPEDRRTLIGVNLSDEIISNIEEGVRTIGIDKVLEDDYTDDQKKAIRKIYGKELKEITQAQLLQAAQAMKQADVTNFFTARYTRDEIKKFAKAGGFTAGGFLGFGIGQAGIDDYLASPTARTKLAELLAEQYKAQGFTVK